MNYLHLPFDPEVANENIDRVGLSDIGVFTIDRINAIQDTDTSEINASSIPDPLARILIFKNAFEYFNKLHTQNANYDINESKYTNQFTLVSDCLDLLELINHNKYKDAILFRDWDIRERVNALKKSTNVKHQHLGNTLELFFNQNVFPTNFVISLIYIRNTDQNEILIGGTSPFTIVYTAPDWKRKLEEAIGANTLNDLFTNDHDTLFDHDLKNIRQRPEAFQQYIHKFLNNQQS